MNDLFGGVVYAGIDTDRYKYPIGSGRVTFGNQKSFMKAVKAGFVEIKTPKFSKKVRREDGREMLVGESCVMVKRSVTNLAFKEMMCLEVQTTCVCVCVCVCVRTRAKGGVVRIIGLAVGYRAISNITLVCNQILDFLQ